MTESSWTDPIFTEVDCFPIEHYVDLTDDEVNKVLARKHAFYNRKFDDYKRTYTGNGDFMFDAFKNKYPHMIKLTRHMGMADGNEVYLFYIVYNNK
jgi:hypothetical protein